MKTKVSLYLCDVDRKLAILALLKETPAAQAAIAEGIEQSLENGTTYQHYFNINSNVVDQVEQAAEKRRHADTVQ